MLAKVIILKVARRRTEIHQPFTAAVSLSSSTSHPHLLIFFCSWRLLMLQEPIKLLVNVSVQDRRKYWSLVLLCYLFPRVRYFLSISSDPEEMKETSFMFSAKMVRRVYLTFFLTEIRLLKSRKHTSACMCSHLGPPWTPSIISSSRGICYRVGRLVPTSGMNCHINS